MNRSKEMVHSTTEESATWKANNTSHFDTSPAVPRMRTIRECHAELKNLDPNTCMTEHAIRAMVNRGDIPVVDAGSKALINFDEFLNILSDMSTVKRSKKVQGSGEIISIPENLPKCKERRPG